MTPIKRYILLWAMMLLTTVSALSQRRVTPIVNQATTTTGVNLNPNNTDSIRRPASVVEMIDDSGRSYMVDTISGTEWVDSLPATRPIPRMEQPLLFAVALSADIATPLMRAFGRHYGVAEIAAELNLHNRYMPVVEVGLGQAHYRPDNNNYTYRSGLSPFFRLGLNYGFLYNSNPDYMFVAGVRYGISPFNYTITDVTPSEGYWGQAGNFDIPSQHATIGYLQFLLGLRVKIIGPISLGWTVRYQSILHRSAARYGEPWYIPGFGSQGSPLSFTFSITYTLRLSHKRLTDSDINHSTPSLTPSN